MACDIGILTNVIFILGTLHFIAVFIVHLAKDKGDLWVYIVLLVGGLLYISGYLVLIVHNIQKKQKKQRNNEELC